MNKRMIYLISLIAAAKQYLNLPKIYSTKFETSGNEYLSPTEKIRIEDLMDFFITAGIVGRTEVLPILGKDGSKVLEFEPDVIGGQFPYSASDLIEVKAGIPMYTKTGAEIPSIKQLEAKYTRLIAASIDNKLEQQCTDAYLKGIYIDKDGKELEVGVKKNETLSLKKDDIIQQILDLALEYHREHKEFPIIEVGSTVFNAIKAKANDSRQNLEDVKFNFSDTPYLTIGTKKINLLVDAEGTDGEVVDTKDLMILSTKSNLALGYGCLTYGDPKTNESKLVRAKVVAGDLRVDETTGSKGLWGKSAPMPIILSTAKFKRYKVKLS